MGNMLKTETSPGYEHLAPGIAERFSSLNVVSAHGPDMDRTDIKRDKITAWEKINKLPMLKRAVVMSEVLGPPKGSV